MGLNHLKSPLFLWFSHSFLRVFPAESLRHGSEQPLKSEKPCLSSLRTRRLNGSWGTPPIKIADFQWEKHMEKCGNMMINHGFSGVWPKFSDKSGVDRWNRVLIQQQFSVRMVKSELQLVKPSNFFMAISALNPYVWLIFSAHDPSHFVRKNRYVRYKNA